MEQRSRKAGVIQETRKDYLEPKDLGVSMRHSEGSLSQVNGKGRPKTSAVDFQNVAMKETLRAARERREACTREA